MYTGVFTHNGLALSSGSSLLFPAQALLRWIKLCALNLLPNSSWTVTVTAALMMSFQTLSLTVSGLFLRTHLHLWHLADLSLNGSVSNLTMLKPSQRLQLCCRAGKKLAFHIKIRIDMDLRVEGSSGSWKLRGTYKKLFFSAGNDFHNYFSFRKDKCWDQRIHQVVPKLLRGTETI